MIWDRQNKCWFKEDVFGEKALGYAYGPRFDQRMARWLVSRLPIASMLYGALQKMAFSKKKVKPFIQRFQIDTSEFEKEQFSSFNDFFIRKIKQRKLPGEEYAIIPADGRYRFFPDISHLEGINAKSAFLSLEELVGSVELAKRYEKGSMVIGRLAPPDYHRFHAPCKGKLGESRLISGSLYSVSPFAMARERYILSKNKRVCTEIDTEKFGQILMIEVGATNVGSIIQSKKAGETIERGEEKGYFGFGGSLLILLFEKGKIRFEADLLEKGEDVEIRCLMGQPLGLPA